MLRFQLLLFSITASVLSVIGIAVVSFTLSAHTIIDINNDSMKQISLSTERDIKQRLKNLNEEVTRWSLHPIIIRSTQDTYIGRASGKLASSWLAEKIDKNFEYDAVILIDEDKNIIASAKNSSGEVSEYFNFMKEFPTYFEMSADGTATSGELYLWRNNGPMYIRIIRLKFLPDTDKKFYIVAGINADNIIESAFTPLNNDNFPADVILLDTKTKSPIGYTDYYKKDRNSGPTLTYSYPMKYPAWTIEVKTSRKDVIKPAFALAEKVSLLCLMTLLLYVTIKFLFIRRLIFNPVSEIHNTIKNIISQKNYSLRAKHGNPDEIGELSSCFNLMLDEIEQRDFRLIKAKNEISETSERLSTARDIAEENRKKAEQANLKKSEFLQSLSYRLRSPLNSIMLLSEEIYNDSLSGGLPEEKVNIMKIVYEGIKNLSDQISNIKNYSDEDIDTVMTIPSIQKTMPGKKQNLEKSHVILIADGNMREMFLLSRVLTSRNFRVLPASDSSDLISRAAEEKPDIILISSKFSKNKKTEIMAAVDKIIQENGAEDTVVAWLD